MDLETCRKNLEKIVGYTVTKVWIDIYCPSKASDPSTKCQTFSAKFKDIRYKNWKTTDPGHIFWHSLLWKKENGIRRKVFGLFAALYHLEEWLNCHWKSVKVIFRVGGHFLYLLMAEQNNFWVLGFGVSRTSNQWKCDLLRLPNILKYMYRGSSHFVIFGSNR